MARVRVTYVTGSSSIADDSRSQWSASGCSGSLISHYALHTITSGSAGTVEIDTAAANAASLSWNITGRSAGGSIHMRFEVSQIGDFSDAVVAFDDTIVYTTAVPGAGVCIALSPTAAGDCQFGTRVQAGVSDFIQITPNFLANAAQERGMAWLAALLAFTYYTTFSVRQLCSGPPPNPGLIVEGDFQGNTKKGLDALGALLWPLLCECVPGTPTPTTPPPFTQPAPPDLPVQPPFVVPAPGDPATLAAILQRLSEIQNVVNQDLVTDNQMQRWRLPFGTVPGTLHEHLVGEGSFAIDRAVGVLITVTTLPTDPQTFFGNPIYLKDLGWIAADDGGAMLQELRVTRQQQAWYPAQMQLATRVSWALRDNVEIAVQELRPES